MSANAVTRTRDATVAFLAMFLWPWRGASPSSSDRNVYLWPSQPPLWHPLQHALRPPSTQHPGPLPNIFSIEFMLFEVKTIQVKIGGCKRNTKYFMDPLPTFPTTFPLPTAVYAASVAVAAPVVAPFYAAPVYATPVAVAAPVVAPVYAAPVAVAAPISAPVYAAPVVVAAPVYAAPVAIAAPIASDVQAILDQLSSVSLWSNTITRDDLFF